MINWCFKKNIYTIFRVEKELFKGDFSKALDNLKPPMKPTITTGSIVLSNLFVNKVWLLQIYNGNYII